MSERPAPKLDLMPSAAERWTTCSASPRFCLENADLIPEDLSSKFSLEGNTAHEVGAAFLQNREPDPKNCPVPIDADMRWHGWNYAEYVQGLRGNVMTLDVEYKQPLWFYDGRNAIVDAAVLNTDCLHIVDYKYGVGVAVSPIENKQLVIYARQIAGPLNLPLDFPIFLHIYQPRNRDTDHPEKVWQTTWGEIKELSDQIAATAYIIISNNRVKGPPLDFVPSEQACRWCPAKAFCPARQADMLDGIEDLTVIDDQPKPLPLPSTVPVEQLAAILRHKDKIKKWLADAEEYALSRMLENHDIPGFKLVLSKGGHRFWRDPKKAAELLLQSTVLKREEVIEESVISVAQVEKLIGKKKFNTELMQLIGKPEGKPVIAPVEDSRDSYLVQAEKEFEVLSDEQLDRLDDY